MSSSSGRASRSRTKCDTSSSPETLPPPESLDELYRSAPEDFVASRNRLVRELKAAGDAASARALAARRKPTRAAHALNVLAREHQADVEAYLGLASEIRTAQVSAARDDAAKEKMRTLDRERRDRLAALVARTGDDQDDVQRALATTLADEDVATAIRNGTLEKIPDAATGFGAFGDGLAFDTATPQARVEREQPTAAERRKADQRAKLDAELDAAENELAEAEQVAARHGTSCARRNATRPRSNDGSRSSARSAPGSATRSEGAVTALRRRRRSRARARLRCERPGGPRRSRCAASRRASLRQRP